MDADYQDLVVEAKRVCTAEAGGEIRLALLADFTTHQLVDCLKALAARAGVRLAVYEAPYDSLETEILDPQSGLHAFGADHVAILSATQKLSARHHAHAGQDDFAAQAVARFTRLWAGFRDRSQATLIQGTYVRPAQRAYGHYDLMVPSSLGAATLAINQGLAEAARHSLGVLMLDLDFLAGEQGRAAWFDERMWSLAKLPCRLDRLPALAGALLDVVFAAAGRVVKCVVLDCDNTLWGGVIGDDGLGGIALGGFDEGEAFVAFQHFLLALRRRGVILAVVSKNDDANARLPFRDHPDMVLREADIAVFLANWDNKADNIRRVRDTLNIGFDTMVFLDDNPFERELVRQHLPQVIVPDLPEDPADYLPALARLNLFETASFSAADQDRAGQYHDEAQRTAARETFTDIGDYLRSLGMVARLDRFSPQTLPRIAQLIQRSNQFNLMTRRHGEAACAHFMADSDGHAPFTISLSDRFGDYGLICVAVLAVSGEDLVIDEFLMSCRVLKRGVEQLAMNAIFAYAAGRGLRRVTGCWRPSGKNAMVERFYADFGFARDGAGPQPGDIAWARDVATWVPQDHCITLDRDALSVLPVPEIAGA
jgi:FkbH-like protein